MRLKNVLKKGWMLIYFLCFKLFSHHCYSHWGFKFYPNVHDNGIHIPHVTNVKRRRGTDLRVLEWLCTASSWFILAVSRQISASSSFCVWSTCWQRRAKVVAISLATQRAQSQSLVYMAVIWNHFPALLCLVCSVVMTESGLTVGPGGCSLHWWSSQWAAASRMRSPQTGASGTAPLPLWSTWLSRTCTAGRTARPTRQSASSRLLYTPL